MSTLIILLSVAGAAIILCLVNVLVTSIQWRGLPKPPPPAFLCPACGCEQVDVCWSALWDGEDSAGRRTGGIHDAGTCRSCGVHCELRSVRDNETSHEYYNTRVLTEAEWQEETECIMELRRLRAEWPFGDRGEKA